MQKLVNLMSDMNDGLVLAVLGASIRNGLVEAESTILRAF